MMLCNITKFEQYLSIRCQDIEQYVWLLVQCHYYDIIKCLISISENSQYLFNQ